MIFYDNALIDLQNLYATQTCILNNIKTLGEYFASKFNFHIPPFSHSCFNTSSSNSSQYASSSEMIDCNFSTSWTFINILSEYDSSSW